MYKDLENSLVAKNINPTSMRLLVLDYLKRHKHAVSLTEIEKGLQPVDRITVYRTLKTFEKKGLVHSIEDGTGAPKYALCKDDCDTTSHHDLHVHFHCNVCAETFCLPNTALPVILLPDGFQSNEMNLVVKGTCNQCK